MEQRVLGGRYLLKDKVGTGGMATVYRAQDQTLDRTVAVKIMLPQYAADATFAARFKQEAQAAAGLSSPYIVGVYDWGKDGDTYYIVMEYLRGTDLKSGIRSHGALDPKKVAQIGSQICGALSVAHNHEIIHRDIKPQNIMVLPDGNIKVMDFGIARAKNSHLTQDNNVLGTAHYVSPEQTRGQELGPTSDIYSLGVVMYECATGRVPFDGDDAISVAMKQVSELPVPPSQINPKIDPSLERIILRCMEKDPANRFQTADELRQVLNNYLSGTPVDVAEPTRVIAGADLGATATTVMQSERTTAMPHVAGATATRIASGSTVENTGRYETERRSGKGKIVAAVIAGIALVAAAVVLAMTLLGGSTVTVPNVLGQTEEVATKALEDLEFEVSTEESYSNDVEEGKVMEQTPDGNTERAKGSKVTIVISKGPKPVEKVKVPNLIGKTAEDAEKALAALDLVGSATEEADDQEEGQVFEQDIDPNTEVDKGTTIKYKVSTGPDTTSVPNLTGMSESQARSALDSAGFGMSTGYDYSDSVSEGLVISWNPSGKQKEGTTITVVISLGSNTQSVPNVVGYSPADAASAIANAGFRYNLVDESGNSISEEAQGVVTSYSPSGNQSEGTTIRIVVRLSNNNTMNGGEDTSGNNTMND